MKLFDSHCHLDDRSYARDLDDVIKRANDAGVSQMMTIGVDKNSSTRAVSLAESRSGIYASVGVHPHDAEQCSQAILSHLRKLAKNPNVKAWGEMGLDFNRMYSPAKDQERCLCSQIEIARELQLPMIFHERDSNGRLLEILKAHSEGNLKGVVHCFSGNDTELEQYLSLGLHIGVTGIVTLKARGSQLRRQVGRIPANRLLVETDAPYLTPTPQKNQTRRNEPAFVRSVLMKLAEVRKEDPEVLADTIWTNTCRLYDIDA
jgi:TatD DNase family protein